MPEIKFIANGVDIDMRENEVAYIFVCVDYLNVDQNKCFRLKQ